MNRHTDIKREPDLPAELESQFVLRLPLVCTITNSQWVSNLNFSTDDNTCFSKREAHTVTVSLRCLLSIEVPGHINSHIAL
jgi:hypothetical protein